MCVTIMLNPTWPGAINISVGTRRSFHLERRDVDRDHPDRRRTRVYHVEVTDDLDLAVLEPEQARSMPRIAMSAGSLTLADCRAVGRHWARDSATG
jgi:hypothetical protein